MERGSQAFSVEWKGNVLCQVSVGGFFGEIFPHLETVNLADGQIFAMDIIFRG